MKGQLFIILDFFYAHHSKQSFGELAAPTL